MNREQNRSTPGPWRYGGQSETWFRVEAPPPDGRDWSADHVCNAFREADAVLIAAAPDLLEALQGLVPFCDEGDAEVETAFQQAWLAARQAIAKATDTRAALLAPPLPAGGVGEPVD